MAGFLPTHEADRVPLWLCPASLKHRKIACKFGMNLGTSTCEILPENSGHQCTALLMCFHQRDFFLRVILRRSRNIQLDESGV